jgi:hypothetical protein
VTTVEEDRVQARIDGLLAVLRDAEADFRRSYARVLEAVAELDAERAGAVTGFGTTARLLSGVLNLSKGEAKARADQAGRRAAARPPRSRRQRADRRAKTMRELRVRTGPDGTASLAGKLDPEGGARVLEVLNSLNGRRPPIDGVPDTRSPARRNTDALVEAMSCLLDEGELPARGGQRPHLVLTMSLSELVTGLGRATLDTGGCLTAAEARRLACDAAIIPMVLSSDSMPLDVGRQHRLATAAIRDALAQRDKGCAFPGCDRPPRYCEAITLRAGSTGAKQSSTTCARCVSTIMSSCTAKDGTSDSTAAADQNSFPQKPWIPPEHHSTTRSGSSTPSEQHDRTPYRPTQDIETGVPLSQLVELAPQLADGLVGRDLVEARDQSARSPCSHSAPPS